MYTITSMALTPELQGQLESSNNSDKKHPLGELFKLQWWVTNNQKLPIVAKHIVDCVPWEDDTVYIRIWVHSSLPGKLMLVGGIHSSGLFNDTVFTGRHLSYRDRQRIGYHLHQCFRTNYLRKIRNDAYRDVVKPFLKQ